MTWDSLIGNIIAIMVFLSLGVVYAALIAPMFIFGAILMVPFFFAVMTPISGALAIAWGWMWDEHEILGTEFDAVPG
jgi:hypothetical protein